MHGIDAFYLQVVVLGPTPVDTGTNGEIPDYVLAEQEYLDNNPCVYNARRTATPAAYSPNINMINQGHNNPSYGKLGENSLAWGSLRSNEERNALVKARNTYTFFLYDCTGLLISVFSSAKQLSSYFPEASSRFGMDIIRLTDSLGISALRYGNFVISRIALTSKDIINMLPDMYNKSLVVPRNSSKSQVIYGYNPDLNLYKTWDTLEQCTAFLTGRRFENKGTINKRINRGILFNGYLLQTTPFDK